MMKTRALPTIGLGLTLSGSTLFLVSRNRERKREEFRDAVLSKLDENVNQKEGVRQMIDDLKISIMKSIDHGPSLKLPPVTPAITETTGPWNYNWDGREPESLVKPLKDGVNSAAEKIEERRKKIENLKAKRYRKIVLIRHGQYNQSGDSDADHTLTELGEEQAILTGKRLNEIIKQFYLSTVVLSREFKEFDKKNEKPNMKKVKFNVRVITSTMTRAVQTGKLIFDQLDESHIVKVNNMVIEVGKELKSCDLLCEGAPIRPDPPIDPALYNPSEYEYQSDGSRIEAAFKKHIHRLSPIDNKEKRNENKLEQTINETEAVEEIPLDVFVCHGNVIRYFIFRSLQLPPQSWLRLSIANASLSGLAVSPSGRVSVRMFGESGHLPPNHVSMH